MLHEVLHTHQLFSFLVWNENNTHWLNSSVIQRLFIDSLKDGFAITIREITEGRVNCVESGAKFIQLQNCKVKQRWFSQIGATSPDDTSPVRYYWYISGDYHIRYKLRGA